MVKNPPANAGDIRDTASIPGSRKSPWRRAWQPTLVFLPVEFTGQKSLAGYSSKNKVFSTTKVTVDSFKIFSGYKTTM